VTSADAFEPLRSSLAPLGIGDAKALNERLAARDAKTLAAILSLLDSWDDSPATRAVEEVLAAAPKDLVATALLDARNRSGKRALRARAATLLARVGGEREAGLLALSLFNDPELEEREREGLERAILAFPANLGAKRYAQVLGMTIENWVVAEERLADNPVLSRDGYAPTFDLFERALSRARHPSLATTTVETIKKLAQKHPLVKEALEWCRTRPFGKAL
jgi:hypothetical protein